MSHIQGIPKRSPSTFMEPCLGGGPINAPIRTLREAYDEDWFEEFLYELDRYVYIESIAGTPWRRMVNISLANLSQHCIYPTASSIQRTTIVGDEYKHLVKTFLYHILRNYPLIVNYNGTNFLHGLTSRECWLQLSDLFIKWYNSGKYTYTLSDLVSHRVITPVVYKRNEFYELRESSMDAVAESTVLTFKGEIKKLKVLPTEVRTQENIQYVINREVFSNFYTIIINYINYFYGKQ